MPTSPPSTQMLASQILVNRSQLQSWLFVINYLLPLASTIVNSQLEAVQTQINNILNATPNPMLAAQVVVIPFTLPLSFQEALNNYQYESGGGMPLNSYADVRSEVNSMIDQVSITFFNSTPGRIIVLL